MSKTKTLFIVKPALGDKPPVVEEVIAGTLEDAKAALSSAAFADGDYRIAEVVCRVNKATITVQPTTKITFEPTRKRPRKAKAEAKVKS